MPTFRGCGSTPRTRTPGAADATGASKVWIWCEAIGEIVPKQTRPLLVDELVRCLGFAWSENG